MGNRNSNTYTGKEFNKHFKGRVFVKLTNKEECHNGYQFKDGLNEDFRTFNPSFNCMPGGIYFCEFDKIHKWIKYGGKFMVHMRTVTMPNDAQVYETDLKFKADKLILGPALSIWTDYDLCYLVADQDPRLITYVPDNLLSPELLENCHKRRAALNII